MDERAPVEGRPLRERDLVENARHGDVDAYEELVRIHQPMALRVAFVVLGERTEAEDAAQEAFVKAFAALESFRVEAPFRPWLLRIVRNEAINRGRHRVRQHRLALREAGDPVSGGAAPSPETVVLTREDRRTVLDVVDGLPYRYRSVIVHRFLLGLSEAETAETLGIPKGTVKSRTSRGLRLLRRALAKKGVGDDDE
ncbi:MAG: sigma-70 family RNA polymerase sigma factor [Acidimicrobiia bacterium]|nr:sigma-70 family RNA polymerase sigma factor [Acidimicrobiia bacterium]